MARNPLCWISALTLMSCGAPEGAPEATQSASPAMATPQPSPRASASPVPAEAEFVAHGNEPFWSVETHSGRIVYASPDKPAGEALAATSSQVDGWTRFDASMDGTPLRIEVRAARCLDDMSGFAFSHEARLTRPDGTWRGCARLASEPQPRE